LPAKQGWRRLAEALLADPTLNPEAEAAKYIDAEKGVADVKAALDGTRQILMEQFAENAAVLGRLRDHLWAHGVVYSSVVEGKNEEGAKFADYFDYSEPLKAIPSHRALALLRGRNEGALNIVLRLDDEDPNAPRSSTPNACEAMLAHHVGVRDQGRAADRWLSDTVRMAWRVKIFLHLELELMNQLREAAEAAAIKVFADNLKDLLLAAPAGPKATMGLDPGLRTGVKVAVVDSTGKLVDTATIYPHAPRNHWNESIAVLAAMAKAAQRGADQHRQWHRQPRNRQAGAGPVQAPPRAEPEKTGGVRSRRLGVFGVRIGGERIPRARCEPAWRSVDCAPLQDPLAELVKIDPKSIGVGQYQHDVNQTGLARSLDAVVEDCVNAVGVDVNTASVPLLTRVSGLTPSLASTASSPGAMPTAPSATAAS
jgi:uncharacterized protein